jgi:hypothetical protein
VPVVMLMLKLKLNSKLSWRVSPKQRHMHINAA